MSVHPQILASTGFEIPGYKVTGHLGIVRGIVVREPTIVQSFSARVKSIVGGRIGAYTEMCEQTREDAYNRMLHSARELGANAILGVRYESAEAVAKHSATEVLCYGTAVFVKPV